MATMFSVSKAVVYVDDEDSDLARYRWRLQDGQYAKRSIRRRSQYLHRAIAERMVGRPLQSHEMVDHVDGNGLNNRRDNLRVCTASENNLNRRAQRNSSSIFKGVWWNRNKARWESQIRFYGQRQHLGTFRDEQEAARAYDAAARHLHGEYARTNFDAEG